MQILQKPVPSFLDGACLLWLMFKWSSLLLCAEDIVRVAGPYFHIESIFST